MAYIIMVHLPFVNRNTKKLKIVLRFKLKIFIAL